MKCAQCDKDIRATPVFVGKLRFCGWPCVQAYNKSERVRTVETVRYVLRAKELFSEKGCWHFQAGDYMRVWHETEFVGPGSGQRHDATDDIQQARWFLSADDAAKFLADTFPVAVGKFSVCHLVTSVREDR